MLFIISDVGTNGSVHNFTNTLVAHFCFLIQPGTYLDGEGWWPTSRELLSVCSYMKGGALPPKTCTEGNFPTRLSRRTTIGSGEPYSLKLSFLFYTYGGSYGKNLLYKFKIWYSDFQNRKFENAYRANDLRSNLRPVTKFVILQNRLVQNRPFEDTKTIFLGWWPRVLHRTDMGPERRTTHERLVLFISSPLLIDLFHMVINFNSGGFVFVPYRGVPYY